MSRADRSPLAEEESGGGRARERERAAQVLRVQIRPGLASLGDGGSVSQKKNVSVRRPCPPAPTPRTVSHDATLLSLAFDISVLSPMVCHSQPRFANKHHDELSFLKSGDEKNRLFVLCASVSLSRPQNDKIDTPLPSPKPKYVTR